MDHTLPVVACPPSHRPRHVEVVASVPHPRQAVWDWLCDPQTFVGGQVWPWRVEFLDARTGGRAGFEPGVLTTHHGPLLNASGVIGQVDEPSYRDLAYTYGAYVISPRICRPVRLQFWLEEAGPATTTMRIATDLQVRRGLGRASDAVQHRFWTRFGRWADAAVRART
jgi:hypothetical protein